MLRRVIVAATERRGVRKSNRQGAGNARAAHEQRAAEKRLSTVAVCDPTLSSN
jgi:hypothetical protein